MYFFINYFPVPTFNYQFKYREMYSNATSFGTIYCISPNYFIRHITTFCEEFVFLW